VKAFVGNDLNNEVFEIFDLSENKIQGASNRELASILVVSPENHSILFKVKILAICTVIN
jgi:hypothetical protein